MYSEGETIVVDQNTVNAALVIGGGVAGQRAALDIAEAGFPAYLVERGPTLGGIVAQLGYMFPTHDCVLCRGGRNHGYGCTRPAISPAFHENSRHPNLTVLTSAEITSISGEAGHFEVSLRQRPQYVDPARCINCNKCAEVCPIEIPSSYHEGLAKRKLIDKNAGRAIPDAYHLWEKQAFCATCRKCEPACPTKAVNLDAQPAECKVTVGAVVLSTGYKLFDPNEYEEYGHGRFPNVLTSLEFERLISNNGPTHGHLLCPSNGKAPKRIAWLQCVGSRDEEHPWCSAICCMHAIKEAILTKERVGSDVQCRVFLMDQRTFNKANHAYYERSRQQYGVQYVRSRISGLREDPKTKEVFLRYQDEAGKLQEEPYDMVVLSVGIQPPAQSDEVARLLGVNLDNTGFCHTAVTTPTRTSRAGVFAAGAVTAPREMAETFIEASAAANAVIETLAAQGKAHVPAQPQPAAAAGPARIGVFACNCGGAISGKLDTVGLSAFAGALPGVVYSASLDYPCVAEGQDAIVAAIKAHQLNRLVIAGCTPRTHLALFEKIAAAAGIPRGMVSMANIREQCAWVHPDAKSANRKAKELARVAIARAASGVPVTLDEIQPLPSVLVLGGGLAGMSAALTLADAGVDVTLAEKTDQLGGVLRRKYHLPDGTDPQVLLATLTTRVARHSRIRVLTDTTLISQSGRPGVFRSILTRGHNGSSEQIALEHGATVVATGGLPYAGSEYLLGQAPQAVNILDFEGILTQEPARVAALKQVVFIQCVGRDETKDSPCSRICCTGATAAALKLKELNPACQVYILNRDVMTYGPREQYYTAAREKGVIYLRYQPEDKPKVTQQGNQVVVTIYEPALREKLELRADLLALSTVTRPAPDTADVAGRLGLALAPDGFYQEAHTKMRPSEFVQPGIFVAGLAHYPKFVEDTLAQAQAVAAGALQLIGHGPIQVGGLVAKVTPEKCVGCLTCVRICPYKAPHMDRGTVGVGGIAGAAHIDPAHCQGCGLCTAECPAKAIELAGYRDDQLMDAAGILGRWQV
jgi:heterodisulfide reductase subunit A